MAAYRWSHVTCRLTAKNRDQLQNPMLDDQAQATFTFWVQDNACDTSVFFKAR